MRNLGVRRIAALKVPKAEGVGSLIIISYVQFFNCQ